MKKNGESTDSSRLAEKTQAQQDEPGNASRRRFVLGSAGYAISLGAGLGLAGCGGSHDEAQQRFGFGVASGDPLADRVILWTRVNVSSPTDVQWEVATDTFFTKVVAAGTASTSDARDFTVKVDATGLQPGTTYFYRFHNGGETSATGRTKTLPVGAPQQVRLAVFSCAAYALGQFHAYADAVNRGDFDVALMLGDYIYETGLSNAEQLAAFLIGREIDPQGELHTLSEYRQRYARYHTDADLRALRATMPVIAVWDDHDIANDLWRSGIGGQNLAADASFIARRAAAVQAWHEWLPTRDGAEPFKISRSFDFGNLLTLHMLDTRLIGRDPPISRDAYLAGAAADPNRQLLGVEQSDTLAASMQLSTAIWQVLGQQVLFGRMQIPLSVFDNFSEDSINEFLLAQDTPEAARTDRQRALVAQPRIAQDLGTWDSFAAAREKVLASARALDKNLVVLAGDSHNAWASDLKDAAGNRVGVEFATPSVTSTGLEFTHRDVGRQFLADSFVRMIPDLKFAETSHRGYMIVTLTPTAVFGDWVFVSSVLENSFSTSTAPTLRVLPGSANRTLAPI
ncbi:MAG TPA: alkaline phosphatase D family protein [Ramlibacter sp.]|nr:alkaline phosphatase D family protein [Ramlibacter sp.]